MNILAVNGGSSSIKFALYNNDRALEQILSGKVDRIGLDGTCLNYNNLKKNKKDNIMIEVSDHKLVATFLIDWLEMQIDFSMISGRIVNF